MSFPGKSFCLQRKQESRNPEGSGDFGVEKGEVGFINTILALLRICQVEEAFIVLISLLLQPSSTTLRPTIS